MVLHEQIIILEYVLKEKKTATFYSGYQNLSPVVETGTVSTGNRR